VTTAATLGAAVFLAIVQVLPRYLGQPEGAARNRWLSAGGGVAVAFVFLQLLPELVSLREPVTEFIGTTAFNGHDIFVLALAGLVAFYGIEVLARRSHSRDVDITTPPP
jgi:hypothetical protein